MVTQTSYLDDLVMTIVNCVRQEAKEGMELPLRMLKTDLSDEWKETLQHAQENDADIQPILKWLKASASKPDWSDVAAMSPTTKSF